jgi:hypothetical protein
MKPQSSFLPLSVFARVAIYASVSGRIKYEERGEANVANPETYL